MAGRNRSQKVFLTVESTRIPFIPVGHYALHIDDVRIDKGSVRIVARIMSSLTLVSSDVIQLKQKEVEKNGD